jgi:hypothetical protein
MVTSHLANDVLVRYHELGPHHGQSGLLGSGASRSATTSQGTDYQSAFTLQHFDGQELGILSIVVLCLLSIGTNITTETRRHGGQDRPYEETSCT